MQAGELVLRTKVDGDGHWAAKLLPGTYDVVFGGPLYGERANDVDLHAGQQEFAPVQTRFAYGHLGVARDAEQSATMGEVIIVPTGMSFRYAAHHPVAYLSLLTRQLLRAL